MRHWLPAPLLSVCLLLTWLLLNQSADDSGATSDWDFGFYATRSWLARLIISPGDEPDQYRVELRAVSP